MQPKQTPPETLANVKALVEYMNSKGKQLILIDEARRDPSLVDQRDFNVSLIDSYMLAHFTEKNSGLTDYSFNNLKKAVVALKQNLHWIKGKAPIENKSGVQSENNKVMREVPDVVSNSKMVKAAEDRKTAEKDAQILRQVSGLIAGHQSYPHSVSFAQRDKLRAEFDRLQNAKMKAVEIEKAIRKMISSFPARGR
jgi:hypothetical protein